VLTAKLVIKSVILVSFVVSILNTSSVILEKCMLFITMVFEMNISFEKQKGI